MAHLARSSKNLSSGPTFQSQCIANPPDTAAFDNIVLKQSLGMKQLVRALFLDQASLGFLPNTPNSKFSNPLLHSLYDCYQYLRDCRDRVTYGQGMRLENSELFKEHISLGFNRR